MMRRSFATSTRVRTLQAASLVFLAFLLAGIFVHSLLSEDASLARSQHLTGMSLADRQSPASP